MFLLHLSALSEPVDVYGEWIDQLHEHAQVSKHANRDVRTSHDDDDEENEQINEVDD